MGVLCECEGRRGSVVPSVKHEAQAAVYAPEITLCNTAQQ